MRKTKIVSTLGPATAEPDMITRIVDAGADVIRINLSHLENPDHLRTQLKLVTELPTRPSIMLDTRGPELRTGSFPDGKTVLERGAKLVVTTKEAAPAADRVYVPHVKLPQQVTADDVILLDDGAIELRVISVSDPDIECRVVRGGVIRDRRKVTVPGVDLGLGPLAKQDEQDIVMAMDDGSVDMVALSFVERPEDVLVARRLVEQHGGDVMLIAKIESPLSVDNVEQILRVCDGLMVARGDLGVKLAAEEVPIIQKKLISLANDQGIPVITATQMLESMINNQTPTRAEASDIANAIFDGTDAIMLSGETAIGQFPVESVEVMDRIARRTEQELDYGQLVRERGKTTGKTVTDAISYGTCNIAQALSADAIITATESGHTARAVARYRPKAPVIAVTPSDVVRHRLAVVWGVYPIIGMHADSTDETLRDAVIKACETDMVSDGDLVVLTAGVPVGIPGTTNLIRVHTVGNVVVRGQGIGKGSVTGKAKVVKTAMDAERVGAGQIVVANSTDASMVDAVSRCEGIIAEEGGLTSHAALLALEYGVLAVVGAGGAVGNIGDGEVITVDADRGLVYRGEARV